MSSSSSISKRLVLVPILAVVATQLFLIRSVSSQNITNDYLNHKCFVKQGKYTSGSKYEEDQKAIIQSLSIGDFRSGYGMMSLGADSNFASVIFQCRGDSYGGKCRTCFATAIAGLRRRCPRDKGGIIWYDQCFMEFTALKTRGNVDYDNSFCMSNPKKVSTFHLKWLYFLSNLTDIAIDSKNTKRLYGAGETKFGTKKVYGMVQCMRDLSIKGCSECLSHFSVKFQECWAGKEGGRFVGRSCSFRFEFYPFLDTKAGLKYLKNV